MRHPLIRGLTPAILILTLAAAGWATAPRPGAEAATEAPSPTATLATMATATEPAPDPYEPNDTAEQATPLTVGQRLDKLSFWPVGDVDRFAVAVKDTQIGQGLVINTAVQPGLDPRVRLFAPDGTLVGEHDERSMTDLGNHLDITLATAGRYMLTVENTSATRPEFKTYSLAVAWRDTAPSASASAAADAAQPDAREPNNTWDEARELPIGEAVTALNFVCPDGTGCVDNDFYAVALKGGLCYLVATRDLASGVDTNIIVYGPNRDQAPPLAGNDDAATGEFRSETTLCLPATFGAATGYVLVGNVGNRPPPEPLASRTYALEITLVPPATPTAMPTSAPAPSSAPSSPAAPTAAPAQPAPVAPTAAPAQPARSAAAPTAPPAAAQTVADAPAASDAPDSRVPAESGVAPQAVARINDAPKGYASVIVATTALHVAPGARTEVIQQLQLDEEVILFGEAQGAWVRVQPYTAVVPGWVYAADLKPQDGTIKRSRSQATTPTATTGEAQPVTDGQVPPTDPEASAAAATLPQGSVTVTRLDPVAAALPVAAPVRLPVQITVDVVAAAEPTTTGAKRTPVPQAGISGVRVQLVDIFGTPLAEARTAATGRVTLTTDISAGAAVFVQVPGAGIRSQVDREQLAGGTWQTTIAMPQTGGA